MQVAERWWHRLLKVLLGCGVALVALGAVFLAYSASFSYHTYHSWDHVGIPAAHQAEANRCISRDRGYLENCGGFYNAGRLLDDLVKNGVIRDDAIPRPRGYFEDGDSADAILAAVDLRAWAGREFDAQSARQAAGAAIFAISFALLLAYGLYRAALYIAHGSKGRQ